MATETYLVKKKFRNNYIARLIWSLMMLSVVYFTSGGVILTLILAYIGYTLIWIAVVEFEAPFMAMENLRFLRITMDVFLYTLAIYITGGVNSFLLLSYIIFIILTSLYSTNRFGIYAIVICIVFYNTMNALVYFGYLPNMNILYGENAVLFEMNQWAVLLTNFVLIPVSVVMNITVHSLYKKYLNKTDELEIERNILKNRNDKIEIDMKLARKIQEQLIPLAPPSPSFHTLYRPMEEVGGDLYDFLKFRDQSKIGIFLSDVSGHGVPAAFITSMLKTIILQAGKVREDPAALLMYLNGLLFGKTAGGFVTAFYGIYDTEERSLVFSNAGHNPPYHLSEGGINLIKEARSMPLAVEDNKFLSETDREYTSCRKTFMKDDRIIFYTDGLVEERGCDDIYSTFEDILNEEILPKQRPFSSNAIIKNLDDALAKWCGGRRLSDDVCVICLEIT